MGKKKVILGAKKFEESKCAVNRRRTSIAAAAVLLMTAAPVAAQAPVYIEVEAQPLGAAIVTLAEQTNLTIVAPQAVVDGKTAPAVSGRLAPEDALDQMLEGSGLYAQRSSGDAIIVAQLDDQTAASASRPMDNIIVTGEKRDRTLQDTVSSVSVYSGETLDRSFIVDVEEILQRTPNVSNGFGGEGLTIRGIPERGLGSGTGDTSQTTAIYIDGAVQTQAGAANGLLSTWDVAQVEVFRGPQTSTQGRSGLAGAIIINTVDPTFEWDARARFSYGSFDRTQYAAAFGGPVIDDILAFRIAGDFIKTDGFTEFSNGGVFVDDPGRDERKVLRGKVLFTPFENFEALLTVAYSDAERGVDVVSGPNFFDRQTNQIINVERTDVLTGSLVMTYKVNSALSVTSITGLTDLESRGDPIAETLGGNGFAVPSQGTDEAITQELRAVYEGSGPWSGVLGAYYANVDEQSERFIEGAFGPFQLLRNDGFELSFENYAVFGEVEYDITPSWTIIAGGRYEREDNSNLEFANTMVTPPNPMLPSGSINFSGDASFDAFLPKAGLTYNFDDDVSLSFTAQKAYRPGGSDIRTDTGQPFEFDPEFTWNYELALRSVFLDGALFLNANAFYVEYQDMQIRFAPDPAAPLIRFIQNAGEAELYGFEMELSWQATEELSLYGSLGLIETEFKEFQFQGQDFSGNEFPFQPNVNAAFGGTWQHHTGLTATLDFTYSGNYFSQVANGPELFVDSFFLADFRVGYERDHWGLFVFGDNVFDADYVDSVSRDFADPTMSTATLGRPRTVGVILQANY